MKKIRNFRVVVGVPSGVTEVEKRAVEEIVRQMGATEVFILEEPMAAAIGAGYAGRRYDRLHDRGYRRRHV